MIKYDRQHCDIMLSVEEGTDAANGSNARRFIMLSIRRGPALTLPWRSGGQLANKRQRWESVSVSETQTRFAAEFYKSHVWKKCKKAYANSRSGLCERCAARGLIVPGEEVHHKKHLTPENITDPAVALNWNNLELLCKDCHISEHRRKRWRVDESGHVIL